MAPFCAKGGFFCSCWRLFFLFCLLLRLLSGLLLHLAQLLRVGRRRWRRRRQLAGELDHMLGQQLIDGVFHSALRRPFHAKRQGAEEDKG